MLSRKVLVGSDALKAILGTGFARGYVLVSELVLLLITTSWMSPAERGIYIAGFALLKTVAIVSSLSLGQIAIHQIGNRDKYSVGDIGGSLLVGSVLFPGIALLSLFIFGYFYAEFRIISLDQFLPLLAAALPIFVLEIYLYSFLTALGRLNIANTIIVIGKTLAWGGVLILALFKHDLESAEVLASLVVGQLAIALGYTVCLVYEFDRRRLRLSFNRRCFQAMVKNSIKLHPAIIGSIVFGGIDILITYKLLGPMPVSEYQIAMQLIAALSVLPFAIAQYGFKLVSQLGAKVAWHRFQPILYKSLGLHCLLSLLGAWVVNFVAHNYFHGQYVNVSSLFFVMIFGAPGLFLGLAMAPFWIGFGHFSITSMLTIVTGAIVLPLSYCLTLSYGTTGTAFTLIVGQTLSVAINGVFILKLRKASYA